MPGSSSPARTSCSDGFRNRPSPTLAFGGRTTGLPLAAAGTSVTAALSAAVRHLAELRHRRIVMICPRDWRRFAGWSGRHHFSPQGLAAHDISGERIQSALIGRRRRRDCRPCSIRSSASAPPTALLLVEPAHAVAAIAFLSSRGLRIGEDVSLLCMADDPAFAWRRPPLAHFRVDADSHVRRILRWVRAVARGRPDRVQKFSQAEYDPGGTIARCRR